MDESELEALGTRIMDDFLLRESMRRRVLQIEAKYGTERGATEKERLEAQVLINHLNLWESTCLTRSGSKEQNNELD